MSQTPLCRRADARRMPLFRSSGVPAQTTRTDTNAQTHTNAHTHTRTPLASLASLASLGGGGGLAFERTKEQTHPTWNSRGMAGLESFRVGKDER